MNRIHMTVAAGLFAAGCAAAQEEHVTFNERVAAPQIKIMSLQGGVMGKPVKGAPYSGVEVSETNQVLADGTRIHNEIQTQVYRDGEGRMRRESGNEVTIWDPVANTSWVLNPKTQTARKLPMGVFYVRSDQPGTAEAGIFARKMAVASDKQPLPPGIADELKVKMKAEMEARVREGGRVETMTYTVSHAAKANTEQLGKRMIEGVNADGTKSVVTIEQGQIGNDRPIQTTSERWYSPELQTVMLTRRSDPRTGEEVFKLINVSRAEPPAYLFQVPAGYQVVEQK